MKELNNNDMEKELKELEKSKVERIPGYNVPIPGAVDLQKENQNDEIEFVLVPVKG